MLLDVETLQMTLCWKDTTSSITTNAIQGLSIALSSADIQMAFGSVLMRSGLSLVPNLDKPGCSVQDSPDA